LSTSIDFLVKRDDLRQCEFAPAAEADDVEVESGEVLLAVDKFGFTSNNITYAAFGEAMNYWAFFPAPEGWGRIPVWGFAHVVRSEHDGLAEGERVFGYLPMSTHLVVRPDQVTDAGFVDAMPHRAELPAAYQQYARVAGGDEKHDDHQAILQPLFMTSFLIEDFLADADLFGAVTVVLASASSKTALGVAFLLSKNRPASCQVIGLTSPRNVSFCERVGYYDRVLPYGGVASLPDEAAVLVDMAGDGSVLKSVHDQFGDNLKYSCIVGATHWEDRDAPGDLIGPAPQFFFAPTQLVKRREDWGPDGLAERYGEARSAFLPSTDGWMKIVYGRGPDAVKDVYLTMLDGKVDPQVGQMLSLAPV
jgi:Protein of unknown function (DUF2855)